MAARNLISSFLFAALLVIPAFASAQSAGTAATQTATSSFSRDGIFGCNYNGSYSMSVGSFGAQGGAYVPVADATVELNTGILVYQQCVLRGIVDRESEAALSGLAKQDVNTLNTGRNGQAMFVQQPTKELNDAATQRVVTILQAWNNGTDVPPGMVSNLAASYQNQLNQNPLACPSWVGDNALLQLGTPGCSSFSQYINAQQYLDTAASARATDLADQWQWGGGFYPQEQLDANGNPETTAPSSYVSQLGFLPIKSGFDKLANANDIDQMVSGLFSGLGNQILSSQNGLTGLAEANGSQPSYLDQMVQESEQGLRQSVVNAALQNLSSALAIEQQYLQVFTGIATNLTQTIQQIRGMESQCWILIENAECVGTTTAQSTWNSSTGTGICYDDAGQHLAVATSTVYSQAVINTNISPAGGLASTTVASISSAQKAVDTINNIIAGVTNTNSQSAQEVAIQQLDTLISQHKIHTSQDVANANEQKNNVSGIMATLLQNVATDWGDGTPNTSNPYDANSGWCNVKNKDVLSMWDQLWKQ